MKADKKCDNIFCGGNGKDRICFWFDEPKKECRDFQVDKKYGLEPDTNEESDKGTTMNEQKCKHDFENAIRKGRAHYVCPKCDKDISFLWIAWYEAEHDCGKRSEDVL